MSSSWPARNFSTSAASSSALGRSSDKPEARPAVTASYCRSSASTTSFTSSDADTWSPISFSARSAATDSASVER